MSNVVDRTTPMASLSAQTALEHAPDPHAADAAREFESYMVSFLAQQLRASLPEGPFSSGATAMFGGLFDQEIGRRVAEGGGLGLRQELERALSSAGVDALPARPTAANRSPGAPRPLPGALSNLPARITSAFGTREDPFGQGQRRHQGLDLAHPEGTPIRAIAGGTVTFAGTRGGYGNLVVVKLPDGTETRYAHCATLDVQAGATVAAGGTLGTVGHTGRATGPHLHFEVREGGRPVDPAAWAAEKALALP